MTQESLIPQIEAGDRETSSEAQEMNGRPEQLRHLHHGGWYKEAYARLASELYRYRGSVTP